LWLKPWFKPSTGERGRLLVCKKLPFGEKIKASKIQLTKRVDKGEYKKAPREQCKYRGSLIQGGVVSGLSL
jgi:hypothetical protein